MNTTTAEPSLDLVSLFGSLAESTRLRIANLLTAGELCVCDLVDVLELPQPTVSRHLARLRADGLVRVRRRGRFAHYRLAEPTEPVHRLLLRSVREGALESPHLAAERAAARARVARRRHEPCPD